MKLVNRLISSMLVTICVFSAASNAVASPIVLDFEGIADGASVNNFYNGGADSSGNAGTNYGVSFSSTSLAVIDSDAGGTGNFGNEPSPSTVLFFLSGGAATMNVAAGFTTGFSFYYASSGAGFINVYDGLNSTGNLLATLNLSENITGCTGDPSGNFCTFTAIGITFDGIARSVDFGGTANQIGFDNITIGSETAGAPDPVPEPATLALACIGFVSILFARRARPRSASFCVPG